MLTQEKAQQVCAQLTKHIKSVASNFKPVYQTAICNDYPEGGLLDISEKFSELVAEIFKLEKHILFNASALDDFDEFESVGGCKKVDREEVEIEVDMQEYIKQEN